MTGFIKWLVLLAPLDTESSWVGEQHDLPEGTPLLGDGWTQVHRGGTWTRDHSAPECPPLTTALQFSPEQGHRWSLRNPRVPRGPPIIPPGATLSCIRVLFWGTQFLPRRLTPGSRLPTGLSGEASCILSARLLSSVLCLDTAFWLHLAESSEALRSVLLCHR